VLLEQRRVAAGTEHHPGLGPAAAEWAAAMAGNTRLARVGTSERKSFIG